MVAWDPQVIFHHGYPKVTVRLTMRSAVMFGLYFFICPAEQRGTHFFCRISVRCPCEGAMWPGLGSLTTFVGVCVLFIVRTSGPQGSYLSCRQCALAALRDVKQYLTEEAGQIAVRDALSGGWH